MLHSTGEALVNPTNVSPSFLAPARTAPATDSLNDIAPWPGLVTASSQIGVPLDDEAGRRFARYRDLLLEWNTRFNLTAVREPDEVERRLFLDALAMIPVIDHVLARCDLRRDRPARLIDVGSGAGIPGLVLKIARPTLDVTLIDATGKKVAFMNAVIEDLRLAAARAVHGRAEELARDEAFRERFDLATARAVASLPTLLELVMPFLDVGGYAFFPKGMQIDEELRAGRRAAKKLSSTLVSSDLIATGNTRLVIVRKTSLTAKAYPRRTGIPQRMPLGGGA